MGLTAFTEITAFTTQHLIMATNTQAYGSTGAAILNIFTRNRCGIEAVGGTGIDLKYR